MSVERGSEERDQVPYRPALGELVGDADRRCLGVVKGELCGAWSLRSVTGGVEWIADAAHIRRASRAEHLIAGIALVNARSRGEIL
ncbi:hypothetical protein OG422_16555 [Streptomyces sp. NBC_01525]|uniref:hypothetical protein n=1 Tax=Streptomyces sp. NBC_01525 TaxID=2903893 RepID=UPI00386C170A